MISWDTDPPPKSRIRIEYIRSFNARGMRRVFGRGDRFGRRAAFNMDVWRDRKGNLFARFWSRDAEVDDLSLAIHGIHTDSIPKPSDGPVFSDAWLPQAFRNRYEQWITGEW